MRPRKTRGTLFRRERESLEDSLPLDHPVEVTTDEMAYKVEDVIMDTTRVTVLNVTCKILLNERLGMTKMQ